MFKSLDPDGENLLLAGGDSLCVQAIDPTAIICAAMPDDSSVRELAGGWASDGSRFVFHDRVATATTFESRVWSLDPVAGELTPVIDGTGILVFDVAVSPGEGEVVVTGSRREDTGENTSGTFSVGEDGVLTQISQVAGEWVEWLPDASGLVVSTSFSDKPGLWLVDRDDGAARLVLAADETLGPPALAGVSPDGEWALVYWRVLVAREFFPAGVSHYSVVSLRSGEVAALRVDEGTEFVGPGFAAFSPSGDHIAYTYFAGSDRDGPLVLATRPVAGGVEEIIDDNLFDTSGPPPSPDEFFFDGELKAIWTEDDRLVLPTRSWAMVLDLD